MWLIRVLYQWMLWTDGVSVLIGGCVGNSYKWRVSYLNLGRIIDRTSEFYPIFPRSYQERARM